MADAEDLKSSGDFSSCGFDSHPGHQFSPMSGKKLILIAIVAVAVGLPAGWILAMSLTPVLWKLEPILHMELAGHSGPSDWVFYVIWAIVVPALFFLLKRIVR